VVDAVDAMTSYRPYQAGLPLDDALAEAAANAGSQFDPLCAARFLSLDRGEVTKLAAAGGREPAQKPGRVGATRA
jgi:HD-GYP domain-containing protein (c-di-GMP phosphodiesterase class II)